MRLDYAAAAPEGLSDPVCIGADEMYHMLPYYAGVCGGGVRPASAANVGHQSICDIISDASGSRGVLIQHRRHNY